MGKFKESKKNNCSKKGSCSLNWKSDTELSTSSFEIRLQNWIFFYLCQISSEPIQSPPKMNIETLLCVRWRSFRCFPTFPFHLLQPGVIHFFVAPIKTFASEPFWMETLTEALLSWTPLVNNQIHWLILVFQEWDDFIINSRIPRDVEEHLLINIFMEQVCSHMTAQRSMGSASY